MKTQECRSKLPSGEAFAVVDVLMKTHEGRCFKRPALRRRARTYRLMKTQKRFPQTVSIPPNRNYGPMKAWRIRLERPCGEEDECRKVPKLACVRYRAKNNQSGRGIERNRNRDDEEMSARHASCADARLLVFLACFKVSARHRHFPPLTTTTLH